jgi:DNA recombination protein RmuC
MLIYLLCGLTLFAACAALAAALIAAGLRSRIGSDTAERVRMEASLLTALRDEATQTRREAADAGSRQRQELATALGQYGQTLAVQSDANGKQLAAQLEVFARQLESATTRMDERLHSLLLDGREARRESAGTLARFGESLATQLGSLSEVNSKLILELRASVENRLRELQTDNAAKLEEMRKTVDEKLNATLEARLGESFKMVSERLDQVHRGLGEMQGLATGVGDLNRMLTGVKTRGIWGEVQLGNLLEQVLTPQQYAARVKVKRGSDVEVDFAIRLPGRGDAHEIVWLPIDAKFPREDYERLLDATERGDKSAADAAASQLENRIKFEARSIRDKYIDPPGTTDFALMYLPTEGLYAEVLRRPGLSEALQRDCRVTVAGPTTLSAILNSLQMGFRTLAIEKRSSEVWTVLGAVKTEFDKFGGVLDKVKKKLDEASNTIHETGTRTRQIQRRLKDVQSLPAEASIAIIGAIEIASEEEPPDLSET